MTEQNKKVHLWAFPDKCWHEWKGNLFSDQGICRCVAGTCKAKFVWNDNYPDDWTPIANPAYDTDARAMMELIEAVAEKTGWMFTGQNWNYYGERSYTALFRETALLPRQVTARADTLPLAVRDAVLAVVEQEQS